MNRNIIVSSVVCASVIACNGHTVSAKDVESLVLAENGRTKYRIVIGGSAAHGEEQAAKELALFLGQITGAEFPVERDDTPASKFEIVLGDTNRKSRKDIPEHLRTDNWEGFVLLREDARVYILGNIPRATLYGVYDFLDVELGVRFLTPDATHVPKRLTLALALKSRMYAPPIERRTIWEGLGGSTVFRNRMNGIGWGISSQLGGVKWVGPKTHTFNALVPVEKYFDDHPEYFAEIEGRRRRQYDGHIVQLCLTNPDVLRIATETAMSWLGPDVKTDPENKYVISVTVNDSPYFCKCGPCVDVNRQEGVAEGGTKMRFVNAIATRLARGYPQVAVETMLYHTELPKKTRPVANVLIQAVHDPDWRYALDDESSEGNRQALAKFRELHRDMGQGAIYNWVKLGTYGSTSFLDPRPNLRFIARNIRIMTENGVRGYFVQTVQSRGAEMQALRYYLIARALWRPDIDDRETIDEFCRLYYGGGAEDVLRHINFLHDEYGLLDRSKVTAADTTVLYDERYLTRADAILSRAESKAETPEIKQRVATCRLPIWKIKLDRAFGNVGKVFAFPVDWPFRFDADDKGLDEQWQKTTDFSQWTTMRIDDQWTKQGEDRRGVGWYGFNFDLPETTGGPLALWFAGIIGEVDIFLDGEKIGEQKLPATSMWQHGFYVPLKKKPAAGGHTLVVRVFQPDYNCGIWKPVAIIDMSVPISDDQRMAGNRFIEVATAANLQFISESYGGRGTQTKKMYYPKVRYFLTHGRPQGANHGR